MNIQYVFPLYIFPFLVSFTMNSIQTQLVIKIILTYKYIRHANFWAFRTYWIRNSRLGGQELCLGRPSGCIWHRSKMRVPNSHGWHCSSQRQPSPSTNYSQSWISLLSGDYILWNFVEEGKPSGPDCPSWESILALGRRSITLGKW